MNTASKATAILTAWTEFIRLEDFSSAQVNEVKCEGITLKKDSVLIAPDVFTDLQKARAAKVIGQPVPWVLSFPEIYIVEKGKKKCCPLFSLDISPILSGSYQAQGWPIESLELAEAGNNLVNFLGLDGDPADNLITRDGLKEFLETTLDSPVRSFEDWMSHVPILKYQAAKEYQVATRPYLFRHQGGGFSFNIKKDIKDIKAGKQQWLKPGNPAYEYLFGMPAPVKHETYYLGAFPTKYPPAASQVNALKHAQTEPLTAVQGPPGSGKTTLILHLIAQQVVRRAISLIEYKKDINNLTVVSSTNARAVENVIERLSKDLPECFFYLNGGNKEAITGYNGAATQLRQALDYLQKNDYDRAAQVELAQQIRQAKKQLLDLETQHRRQLQQRKQDEIRQPILIDKRQTLSGQLSAAQAAKALTVQQISQWAYFEALPENIYKRLRLQLSSAQIQLSDDDISWWSRLNNCLRGKSEQQVLSSLASRCQDDLASITGSAFEIDLPTSRVAITRQLQRIEVGLAGLEDLKTAYRNRDRSLATIDQTIAAQQKNRGLLKEVESRLSHPVKDFYDRFSTDQHEFQINLFKLSRKFLAQETLRRKTEVKEALSLYLGSLPGDPAMSRNIKRMEENLDAHLQAVSLMFPIVTSTLLSIRNMLPWVKQCASLAIIDEAGMISMHQPFPLLIRTQRATVVGDPFQIQPIINLSEKTREGYFSQFFSGDGLTSAEIDRYSPSEIKTATAYHRAAGASGRFEDIGTGIKLIEHYRCHPHIIGFSNKIIPYGLVPKTSDHPSLIGPNLVAYHTEGRMEGKVNQQEVEAVKKVVQHLISKGYSSQDIGVVSAFKAQADSLREALSEQAPWLEKEAIGTVHTFQGSERRVIILSTKVCRQRDNISWFDRDPNLLNVAVSRARELFVLVGNLHLLEAKGSYTRELVEYIQEHGVVLEYSPPIEVPEEYAGSAQSQSIYDCDHLDILEAALLDAQEEICVVAPRIIGDAALHFIRGAESALRRGVKVTVRYGLPESLEPDDASSREERALRDLFASHTGARLIKVGGEGTESNVLVCDGRFAVMGSWQWLSHRYGLACRNQAVTPEVKITETSSFLIRDPLHIQSIKDDHGLS